MEGERGATHAHPHARAHALGTNECAFTLLPPAGMIFPASSSGCWSDRTVSGAGGYSRSASVTTAWQKTSF